MKNVVLLAALLAGAVHAADPKSYTVDMTITTPNSTTTPRVMVHESEAFKVTTGEGDAKMSASFVVTPAGAGTVRLEGSVRCADGKESHPVLIARLGESAAVKIQGSGDKPCELAMLVSEETQPASAK
ncbi:MAG TPA: hypothetical protein VFS02_00075 [Telluria sp.]|nr:hypothetical protein [Telluria sp.]